MRRLFRHARTFAFGAAGFAIVFFALKIWIADVYTVRTPSMEPTIDGSRSERLLVRYGGRRSLERFDLAVFTEPGSTVPVIKRVVALPGESVQIVGGDVLIDGVRLTPSERWPVVVPVFDDALLDPQSYFHLGSANAWQRDGALWHLDALDFVPGSRAGTMGYHKLVGTGYLRASGEQVHGEVQANDVVLTLVVDEFEGEGHVLVEVLEEGDQFQLRIARRGAGLALELHRLPFEYGGPATLIAQAEVGAVGSKPFEVRLANCDNTVRATIDGELALEYVYESNRPYRGMTQTPEEAARGTGTVRKSIAAQAVFGGVGVRATFSRIRVARDLYYATSSLFGDYASMSRLQLGPTEYFVLGDNTLDSLDGRRFGPLDFEQVVGRAVAVVWPLGRARSLR